MQINTPKTKYRQYHQVNHNYNDGYSRSSPSIITLLLIPAKMPISRHQTALLATQLNTVPIHIDLAVLLLIGTVTVVITAFSPLSTIRSIDFIQAILRIANSQPDNTSQK